MPVILHAQCSTCGRGPEMSTSLVGWDAKELPEGGKRFGDPYSALKLDNGKFVGLPHPGEHRTIESLGFDPKKVYKEGRVYGVKHQVCSECGLVQEEAWTGGDRSSGCMLVLSAPLVSLAIFKLLLRLSWPASAVIALGVMVGAAHLANLLVRSRWQKVNEELKLNSCSGCGGKKFVSLPKLVRDPMPCPFCKTKTMKYSCAAIS